jgi:hypothetical protein
MPIKHWRLDEIWSQNIFFCKTWNWSTLLPVDHCIPLGDGLVFLIMNELTSDPASRPGPPVGNCWVPLVGLFKRKKPDLGKGLWWMWKPGTGHGGTQQLTVRRVMSFRENGSPLPGFLGMGGWTLWRRRNLGLSLRVAWYSLAEMSWRSFWYLLAS